MDKLYKGSIKNGFGVVLLLITVRVFHANYLRTIVKAFAKPEIENNHSTAVIFATTAIVPQFLDLCYGE